MKYLSSNTFTKLSFCFFIFLTACKSHEGEKKKGILSNLISISNNEDRGIKEMIRFYGGQCEYGIQKKASTSDGIKTTFWLKFTKSAYIDTFSRIPELPVSNIAYIFYKNLEKEKESYNQIQSEVVFGNGSSYKADYSIADLEKVKIKMELVNKIVAILKTHSFIELRKFINIDTSIANYDPVELISKLERTEPTFGAIKQFIPYGFKLSTLENNKRVLHISGLIKRETGGTYFNINLNPDITKEEIYSMNYQL
jgi:hypothetical protein